MKASVSCERRGRLVEAMRRVFRAAATAGLALFVAAGLRLTTAAGAEATTDVVTNRVSAALLTSMDALDDQRKLISGDQISLRIIEDQEEPRRLVVKHSGQIDAPYIGLFPAEGKTCKELAFELKAAFERDYYYRATVIVSVDQISATKGRIYLVGAVGAPGPQEIPGDELFTVSRAIMRAGGFNELADKRRVKITRRHGAEKSGAEVIVVNVGEIIEKARTDRDIELMPGDIVYVPERFFNF